MKTILIVYPDESLLETGKNPRQLHYDINIIDFFDRLRAEKNDCLYFFKSDKRKLNKSILGLFDYLSFEMIVTYPIFPEIEQYAEERNVLYFVFDHFSKDSRYLDRFWLFNRHTIKNYEKFASHLHSSRLLPLSKEFTYNARFARSGRLSPLSKESTYYARFAPLLHNNANIFYKKDTTIILIVIDKSFQETDGNDLLMHLINAALKNHSHLFGDKTELVLYDRSKELLVKVAQHLRRTQRIGVHIVHDHFANSENSIYSMIQKSDLIFSCRGGFGVDAIVFEKPVVFIGTDKFLFKELNRLVTGPNSGSVLHRIGQRQHEYLSNFVLFLVQNSFFFSNASYNSNDFHKRLSKVINIQTNKGKAIEKVHVIVPRKKRRGESIVPGYIDSGMKAQRLMFAYLRKIKIDQRKFAKLQNDPHAFFRDSKLPLFRLIASYLFREK